MKSICEQQVEAYRLMQRERRNMQLRARLMQPKTREELFAILRGLYEQEESREKSLAK